MKLELIIPAGQRKKQQDYGIAEIFNAPPDRVTEQRSGHHFVEAVTHGRKTEKNASVATCFESMRVEGFQRKINEIAESVYRSKRMEPLGKGRVWDFTLPERAHAYGKPQRSESSVVDVFAAESHADTRQVHDLYKKSHHDFYPGERVNRKYEWPPGVNDSFAFGLRETRTGSVSDSLKWDSEHVARN